MDQRFKWKTKQNRKAMKTQVIFFSTVEGRKDLSKHDNIVRNQKGQDTRFK